MATATEQEQRLKDAENVADAAMCSLLRIIMDIVVVHEKTGFIPEDILMRIGMLSMTADLLADKWKAYREKHGLDTKNKK